MSLIKISESNGWIVDYDRERGMYRVSYFEDNHFVDECWFDAYEEREITNKTELIRKLEMLKENSKDSIGYKYISGNQFRAILDRIISYINT